MARFLLITMVVDAAHREEVFEAYKDHGRVASETELGLVRFDVHQDEADPSRLYLYEAYADDAAHRAHMEGESHKRARGLVDELIAQGKCKRLEPVRMKEVFTHAAAGTLGRD